MTRFFFLVLATLMTVGSLIQVGHLNAGTSAVLHLSGRVPSSVDMQFSEEGSLLATSNDSSTSFCMAQMEAQSGGEEVPAECQEAGADSQASLDTSTLEDQQIVTIEAP